ncbi:nucleobase:cation symporter-2 family protein [Pseudoxanthobacter sp.]|uniref:nucleobase:cation symporter-2 family protein n=1 Tax=Pseudoxanthobacter sp. TaxID=1925742 RepID=UPI002FE24E2A
MASSDTVHPVDAVPPAPRLIALGFQHVFVMYAGAIAVPLIIGRAAKLAPDQVALLINADLLACGIATLIQSFGLGRFAGIRLPVMMGCTFAAVGPMVAMANDPDLGLLAMFGSVIAAGVFTVIVAPFMSRLLPLFPPVVTGTVILIIGLSLMRIGINWAAGAAVDTLPGYGAPLNLAVAAFVLLVILAILRFGHGFLRNIAVLAGIVIGAVVTYAIGVMTFDKVAAAAWFGFVPPFHFGLPVFDPISVLTMCVIMVIVMIESTGMFLAVGDMVGKPVSQEELTRGLRADGLGTLIGGIFNTFPYTSFSQNVGLVGVTGVRSRFVCVVGGLILLAMGLVPKLGALVEAVPIFVLGGAGLVMFGMVAATGVRILAGVDYKTNPYNLYIVAISIGFGMIPTVAPKFFDALPDSLDPVTHSGIVLTAISAVVLNLVFNGWTTVAAAEEEARNTARSSEALH